MNLLAAERAQESFGEPHIFQTNPCIALRADRAPYDRAKDEGKAIDAANRLLQLNSNHVRALAFLVFTKRAVAEAGVDETKNAADAFEYGMRGLEALNTFPKPLGMSDDNFEKLKIRTTIIFEGAAGFGSLQIKNYPAAQQHLQSAVDLETKAKPDAPYLLRNVYPLALAYLDADPVKPIGFWYIARAVALSGYNAKIAQYGRAKYAEYHGSEEGWGDLIYQPKTATSPAPDFGVQRSGQPYFASLFASKDWTPTTIEIKTSTVINDALGHVSATAVIAGQREVLLCTYDCATLQPGNYRAEVKKGEFRVYGVSIGNHKPHKQTFRITGTW